jgi:hypothetical protein
MQHKGLRKACCEGVVSTLGLLFSFEVSLAAIKVAEYRSPLRLSSSDTLFKNGAELSSVHSNKIFAFIVARMCRSPLCIVYRPPSPRALPPACEHQLFIGAVLLDNAATCSSSMMCLRRNILDTYITIIRYNIKVKKPINVDCFNKNI